MIGRSRAEHGLLVIEDAAQGLIATYRGAAARRRSATSAALSFHETKNVISRRGRGAARQRPGAGRARRDHPGEGHEPEPVLPRPGRQVHLGRPRLVLPAERDHRRVPLGAARGRHEITAARHESGSAITTPSPSSSDSASSAAGGATASATTTRTSTTCSSHASRARRAPGRPRRPRRERRVPLRTAPRLGRRPPLRAGARCSRSRPT